MIEKGTRYCRTTCRDGQPITERPPPGPFLALQDSWSAVFEAAIHLGTGGSCKYFEASLKVIILGKKGSNLLLAFVEICGHLNQAQTITHGISGRLGMS